MDAKRPTRAELRIEALRAHDAAAEHEAERRKERTIMRLTDEQIRETVAAMKMSEADKALIIERALNGEQGARFVVFHAIASAKRREG